MSLQCAHFAQPKPFFKPLIVLLYWPAKESYITWETLQISLLDFNVPSATSGHPRANENCIQFFFCLGNLQQNAMISTTLSLRLISNSSFNRMFVERDEQEALSRNTASHAFSSVQLKGRSIQFSTHRKKTKKKERHCSHVPELNLILWRGHDNTWLLWGKKNSRVSNSFAELDLRSPAETFQYNVRYAQPPAIKTLLKNQ